MAPFPNVLCHGEITTKLNHWFSIGSVVIMCGTHSNPCLCEVGPHGDLLPCAHVGVAVPLKGGLQLLELLAGEVGPLPALLLLQRAVLCVRLICLVLVGLLCVWEATTGMESYKPNPIHFLLS